jgi:hypothetical protein
MITIKTWMEIFNYRITEGDTYGWRCYGQNAYQLSAWNGIHDTGGWSGNIVVDSENQTVYEVTVCDYTNQRAYRIINPDYTKSHNEEAKSRGVSANEAWDDVNYVDLDVVDDFIQKAVAIVNDEDYDTRVSVPVDFTDEELLTYMKMAHDRDMTFNQFVEQALRAAIDEFNMREEYDFSDAERGPVEQTVKKLKKKKKDKK